MENKLMMSQKEECTNYNLITENINKLVNMCGNTKEAIEIRDNLFDLFTRKYSEPLFTVLGLQEDLGCPLDVFFKAFNGMYIIDDWHDLYFAKPIFIDGKFKIEQHYGVYDVATYYLEPKDYKKTWGLKEDKSE